MCGSAVIMEPWRHEVPAILMLWYPGMEGGHALADIVLGAAAPSGRLPFAIPTDPSHLPPFDPDASTIEYGPLHGQRLLDHLGVAAAFPYGHGLSYP
jgi:beta-glucosidase